ncbi:MAG: type II toxin-antitoxin system RelE/ParE family toxin [Planctomycetes bacterium]|nr:type II toxin-antitoxin system RelE/ParE family toxin [Planctomycetota bacterium]
MSKIIRSSRSKADVLKSAQYIAEKSGSVELAERWMETVDEKLEFLVSHPMAGESRPDLGSGTRASAVGNYIIFYRRIDDGIEVSRILHGARDTPRIFRTGEN